MTTTTQHSAPPLSTQRLAQFIDAIQHLPDQVPAVPAADGVDDSIDQLGDSIRNLAARLAQRQHADETLTAVTRHVLQGVYLEEVLDHIYEGFRGLLPYDRIGCALLEENATVLRARWARTESPTVHLPVGYAANISASSLATVVASGRPRILNDLQELGRDHAVSDATRLILREGVRSSLTCPLISMGRPVGVLFFSSTKPFQYATIHTQIFEQLAGIISAVVERSVLYDQLTAANEALRSARDALQVEATHDALTGIKNRRAILQRVDEVQRQGRRRPRESALILLDIDHFKAVNDTYGHPAGDAVLCEVARRIASAIRADDELGRYGGEEFLVCLDEVTPNEVTHIAARILDAIRAQPIPFAGGSVSVTASAGLCHTSNIATADVEAMIGHADASLYRAKAAGRDRFMGDVGASDEHTRH